jgi:hypothetical protein
MGTVQLIGLAALIVTLEIFGLWFVPELVHRMGEPKVQYATAAPW